MPRSRTRVATALASAITSASEPPASRDRGRRQHDERLTAGRGRRCRRPGTWSPMSRAATVADWCDALIDAGDREDDDGVGAVVEPADGSTRS